MSGEEEGGEKSFEPSQRRLDEARKRGEAPRSADLVTAAAYGGFVVAALAFGAGSLTALGGSLSTLLAQAAPLSEEMFAGGPEPLWGGLLGRTAAAAWPWFAVPAAFALLATLAQGGITAAPEKLTPKGSRISPLAVIGQKFGRDGLVEFAKGLAKIALFGTVAGMVIAGAAPRLLATVGQGVGPATLAMLGATTDMLARVALVALALGLGDVVWQRLAFLRRHRMTRREVTDEMKESEGDPYIKQQRRARAVAIAMNRMLADVPLADVVIVNPTHYAVALKWDRARGGAPTCLAKGVDEIAARIRERATEAGVPIRSDPPTARALYAALEIGQEVARADWRAVAAAIRFAERIRAKAKGQGR